MNMVELMHQESLERFGGSTGIRDRGLLESARARPLNIHAYDPDASVFKLAAAYCADIVRNHPFVDGNKRTGILAAQAFLTLNGYEFAPEEPMIVTYVFGLVSGEISEDAFTEWLRASSRKVE